jgi:hypothetical protein
VVRKALVFGVILIAGGVAPRLWLPQSKPAFALPALILWAWERPENLEFIDPREAGVAYLAGTLELRGGAVVAVPRLQPLRIPPATRVMAVVRVESGTNPPPRLSPEQREQAVSAIVRMASRPGLTATQIDFDARTSERAFYAGLLRDLRERLPRGQLLSITALASWCLDDDWIAGLPIDEAVPMLFRMGPDDSEVRRRLRARRDFQDRACRLSAGVSTDEPLPALPAGRRVYIFHPRPWTATAATNIMRQVKSWQ